MEQHGKYYKVLSNEDVLNALGQTEYMPIQINKSYDHKLKTNLIVPPVYQAYSLAIEYMSYWFYSKFPSNFFKHKFLDASHVLDQFRKLRNKDLLVVNKPAAHIVVDQDRSYNRERIDLHNLGLNLYSNHCSYKDAFFIDREKHIYISMVMKMLLLNFNFSIRVATRSVQQDISDVAEMAFRAGGSQKHYLDVDYPIPKELIGQLACDLNMCNDNNLYNVIDMLHYLNQRSGLAFLYKFNTATGNMDYFLRVPRVMIHIRTGDINIDQGTPQSMITNNYTVNFECQVRFPAIKFFAYYSYIERESIKSITKLDTKSFLVGVTNLCSIPHTNSKGWNWDFRTTYTFNSKEELEKLKNKELLSIDINEITGEFRDTIEYTKSIAINPEVFIEIKAFNYVDFVPIEIDWDHMIIHFLKPLTTAEVHLIFYINKEYIHNTMSMLKQYDKYRLKPHDDKIGPNINIGTKLPNL